MAYRPAQVYNGSTWDDIGDKRMLTHNHGGGANGANIPQSSVTNLTSDLASKLDIGGGKIVQIVRDTDSLQQTTTNTSFVNVPGVSVTITPTLSTSAILLIATYVPSPLSQTQSVRITDTSGNPISGAENAFATLDMINSAYTLVAYATPATTSATLYKLMFRTLTAGGTARIQGDFMTTQLYAIEVTT
jgi:hypothetical protein